MACAIITMGLIEGTVTNLIEADDEFTKKHLPKDQIGIKLDEKSLVGIGWGYQDGIFIEPPQPIYDNPVDPKDPDGGDKPIEG